MGVGGWVGEYHHNDITDARKIFGRKMQKVKKDAQREYCLLGVYREV